MSGKPRRKKHPKGKLRGSVLLRVHALLDEYDFVLPGHCIYKHKITERPEILKLDPAPLSATRAENEEAFHFYNFKKFEMYRSIMDGGSYTSISRRINNVNKIRWKLVEMNQAMIFKYFARNPAYRQWESDAMLHMHRVVDRFNPKLKFAPSTLMMRAMINHARRCYKGNANQQNMNYVFASQMGHHPGDEDFQEAFESHTTDIQSNDVLEEVEFNEQRARVKHLMTGIKRARDREVIQLRFFSQLTLEEIGERLEVSKERIRQLEMRAIEDMQAKESRDRFRKIAENHRRSLQDRHHLVGS